MPQLLWDIDASGGYLANSRLSKLLRERCDNLRVLERYCTPEPGAQGKNKGDTILLDLTSDLDGGTTPADYLLSETDLVPESTFTVSQKTVTMQDYGRAVPFTKKLSDFSEWQIENIIEKKLKRQAAKVLDKLVAAAFRSGDYCYIPTGAATYTLDTDGVPSSQATANLSVWHIETIRDLMRQMNIPPFTDNGEYICVLSTKARRGIFRDTDWKLFHAYTSSDRAAEKDKGILSPIEGIRFVEETNALDNAMGAAGILGECFIFGDDAVRSCVAEPLNLRVKIPEQYGRSKGIGWFWTGAYKCPWEYAVDGEARIVWVTSS